MKLRKDFIDTTILNPTYYSHKDRTLYFEVKPEK